MDRRQNQQNADEGQQPFSACFITTGSLKTEGKINSINPLILQQDIRTLQHPHQDYTMDLLLQPKAWRNLAEASEKNQDGY